MELARDLHRLMARPRILGGPDRNEEGDQMSVAKVTELSCTSNESFEDAIRQGIERATKTLRGVRSAWIKEQRVNVSSDGALEFQANILVTFILEN
jgi:flavin-binding protein dodecin